MVTELRPKCYTCLDPIAPADLASSAGLTCCQGSNLDRRNTAHRLFSIIEHQHTNIRRQHTRSKQGYN